MVFLIISSTVAAMPPVLPSRASLISCRMQCTSSRRSLRTAARQSSATCSESDTRDQAELPFCGDFSSFNILTLKQMHFSDNRILFDTS